MTIKLNRIELIVTDECNRWDWSVAIKRREHEAGESAGRLWRSEVTDTLAVHKYKLCVTMAIQAADLLWLIIHMDPPGQNSPKWTKSKCESVFSEWMNSVWSVTRSEDLNPRWTNQARIQDTTWVRPENWTIEGANEEKTEGINHILSINELQCRCSCVSAQLMWSQTVSVTQVTSQNFTSF